MPDLPPAQLALYAAAVLAVGLLGWRWLGGSDPPPAPAAAISVRDEAAEGGRGVVVHVAGAVRAPGVYRLRAGARVVDAVRKAGGATRRADLSGLNLAAEAQDGRQVLVPRRTPAPGAATGAAPTAPAGGPVNLNQATPEQLDALPGVGPATAAAIIEYRDEHGGFGAIEELDQVPGIGSATLEQLRDAVTV